MSIRRAGAKSIQPSRRPSRTDKRPSVRAIHREKLAIGALLERRHERFDMGYLMGINVALLWMSEKDTAPPTVMFRALQDMRAAERKRKPR